MNDNLQVENAKSVIIPSALALLSVLSARDAGHKLWLQQSIERQESHKMIPNLMEKFQ